jgi:hypothetical protein
MSAYERYLEDLLEVKQKEIDLYRKFIEGQLRCTIQEEVMSDKKFDRGRVEEGEFKVITIPESKFVIQIN